MAQAIPFFLFVIRPSLAILQRYSQLGFPWLNNVLRLLTLLVFFFMINTALVRAEPYRPFFDSVTQYPIDPTPEPPVISTFGQEALKLCSGWGGKVSRQGFTQLLNSPPASKLIQFIEKRLKREYPQRKLNRNQLLSLLTKTWMGTNGFRHIYCGEPKRKKLGGLHYFGRYLQMQEQGWGGLDESCHRMDIANPIYTIGLFYQRPDGTKGRACVKGYSHSLDAEELFIEVSLAHLLTYAFNEEDTNNKRVCRYLVEEDGHRYHAVFVAVAKGVITFYPVTPGTHTDMQVCF